MHLMSQVQSLVGVSPLSTKELCQIIPMHMINREIIPGRKKRVPKVYCMSSTSVSVADTMINSVKTVSRAGVAEAKIRG